MIRKNIAKIGQKRPKAVQNGQTAQLSQQKKRRARRDKDSKYLEPEEIDALFGVIKKPRDRAIFRVAYHRGLRASEVGMLQLSDFNERIGKLFVHRLKGSDSASQKLLSVELTALRAWVKERGPRPGPLFPSQMGVRVGKLGIHRNRLDQLMKTYCALAGIPGAKAHMHALKHSCGTHLAEMGQSAHFIQDHLGHINSKSTDVYMNFTQRMRDEGYDRIKNWR